MKFTVALLLAASLTYLVIVAGAEADAPQKVDYRSNDFVEFLREVRKNESHSCNRIKLIGSIINPLEQLEVVADCLGNLINGQRAWELVLDYDTQKFFELLSKLSSQPELGRQGQFWLRGYQVFLKNHNDLVSFRNLIKDNISPYVLGTYGKQTTVEIVDKFVSQVCQRVSKHLKPFWVYIDGAGKLLDNENVGEFLSYDQSLFKLVVVYKTCEFMNIKM